MWIDTPTTAVCISLVTFLLFFFCRVFSLFSLFFPLFLFPSAPPLAANVCIVYVRRQEDNLEQNSVPDVMPGPVFSDRVREQDETTIGRRDVLNSKFKLRSVQDASDRGDETRAMPRGQPKILKMCSDSDRPPRDDVSGYDHTIETWVFAGTVWW